MMRDALKLLYLDRCDIYEYVCETDELTHLSVNRKKLIYENIPCRLCFGKSDASVIKDGAGWCVQNTELILNPDIQVNPGASIAVVKYEGNEKLFYKASGKPSVYSSHQEIQLISDEARC